MQNNNFYILHCFVGTTTQSLFICQWVVALTTHHLVNRLNSFIVLDDDDIFEDI